MLVCPEVETSKLYCSSTNELLIIHVGPTCPHTHRVPPRATRRPSPVRIRAEPEIPYIKHTHKMTYTFSMRDTRPYPSIHSSSILQLQPCNDDKKHISALENRRVHTPRASSPHFKASEPERRLLDLHLTALTFPSSLCSSREDDGSRSSNSIPVDVSAVVHLPSAMLK